MSSKLAEILFKDYRRHVLALLLLNPDKQYHVREIARLTGTVAGTLHKELSRLAEAGILDKKKNGNQVQYFADQNCPIFDELASILRKTFGAVEVLAQALATLEENIDVALIFGSLASGKETAASDIDLLVIGKVTLAEVAKAVYSSQDVLQREINPKVYTKKEWEKLQAKKDGFAKEVMKQPKLFIKGAKDELE
ncbi:MAG: nucleotidyltransferase domain-containing protein [Proteobacteria bacterium]|nr:nucleotidyltransferase domain-containing protein [Pseudomonadota bacterium]NOG58976.1 nucleotidyltransferase domain-containing protein [Pseudomonadota bacterium]